MTDTKELRLLTQAVVKGWGNCDQAWLDQSEDTPAAVVGHIDEDGNTYPVATIDCDQYYAGHQSLPLAKFYAAANPAAISELLDRLEAAEKERDNANAAAAGVALHAGAMQARLEAAEKERDELRAKLEAVHSILDNDESKIIRNAKDGYPEGREPKELTLTERVTALCKYAADWKRWLSESESKIEEMEKQQPVAWIYEDMLGRKCLSFNKPLHKQNTHEPLYAFPGAKGEEK